MRIWTDLSFSQRKGPTNHGPYQAHSRAARTDVKAIFSFEPSPESAVMMATDMPAAISAYSMAVAPLSSRAKRARSTFMIQNSTAQAAVASQSSARFDIVAQFAKIERNSFFSVP